MGQGGIKDLRRHEQTALHLSAENSHVAATPLSSYFGHIRETAVIDTEVKFGYFVREHHPPIQNDSSAMLVSIKQNTEIALVYLL